MQLFTQIKDSFFNPDWYERAVKQKGGEAYRYFLKLILLVAVVQMAALFQPVFSGLRQVAEAGWYPSGLVLTIHQGEARSNQPEPVMIPFSKSADEIDLPRNIVVIDTTHEFTPDHFKQLNTIALVMKTGIALGSPTNGATRIYDFNSLGISELIVDRAMIEKFSPRLMFLAPLIFLLGVLVLWIFGLFRFLGNFLYALFVKLVGRYKHRDFTYGEAYRLGLYAMTPPLLVQTALDLLTPMTGFGRLPFLFTILFILTLALNLKPAEPQPTQT